MGAEDEEVSEFSFPISASNIHLTVQSHWTNHIGIGIRDPSSGDALLQIQKGEALRAYEGNNYFFQSRRFGRARSNMHHNL